MSELSEKTLSDFDKVRRRLSAFEGVKGTPFEMEYARLYDVLALGGVGNRRRLRKKYRAT